MDHALILFAQQFRPPPQQPQMSPVVMLVVWGAACAGALVGVALHIMYLVTLYRTFGNISARNRTMEPGMVFLNLIPAFGFVWQFFVVIRLAESLKNEFRDRGMRTADEGFGYGAGMTMAIGTVICCSPVQLVGLVMHWMQISAYNARISSKGNKKRRRDEEDRDDED